MPHKILRLASWRQQKRFLEVYLFYIVFSWMQVCKANCHRTSLGSPVEHGWNPSGGCLAYNNPHLALSWWVGEEDCTGLPTVPAKTCPLIKKQLPTYRWESREGPRAKKARGMDSPLEEGRVRQGGGVVRQWKTADQSVGMAQKVGPVQLYCTGLIFCPYWLFRAVFKWRKIVFHTPSCHTLYIK